MNQLNRRRTIIRLACGGAALATVAQPRAQSAHVDEDSETAVALGYKHDTTKVDGAKFPTHDKAHHCANCGFWQGASSDAWAGCSMFGRKQVSATGWCVAWRKP